MTVNNLQFTNMHKDDKKPGTLYKNVERSFGRMILYNFFGGIVWGLGVLIGTTIIFALIAYFVTKVDFVPIFGEFAARVIENAQTNLSTQ